MLPADSRGPSFEFKLNQKRRGKKGKKQYIIKVPCRASVYSFFFAVYGAKRRFKLWGLITGFSTLCLMLILCYYYWHWHLGGGKLNAHIAS